MENNREKREREGNPEWGICRDMLCAGKHQPVTNILTAQLGTINFPEDFRVGPEDFRAGYSQQKEIPPLISDLQTLPPWSCFRGRKSQAGSLCIAFTMRARLVESYYFQQLYPGRVELSTLNQS